MNDILHALAEPNRFHIVELLRSGPRSVTDIAEELQLRQPQTSKHLYRLRKAGLVKVQPTAQHRIYMLQEQPFKELDAWIDSFASLWEERFEKLDTYLTTIQENNRRNDNK